MLLVKYRPGRLVFAPAAHRMQCNGTCCAREASMALHLMNVSAIIAPGRVMCFVDGIQSLRLQGYAVPYDFVDSSVTGALADFVAQARHAGA